MGSHPPAASGSSRWACVRVFKRASQLSWHHSGCPEPTQRGRGEVGAELDALECTQVRVFTYPVFFAIGAVVCPLETLTDLRKRAASVDPPGYCIWLLNAACWTYSVTCTACALPRSNLWNSANPSAPSWVKTCRHAFSRTEEPGCCQPTTRPRLRFLWRLPGDWLTRFPAQLEMMAASVISPILLFMLMPDSRVPLLTWAGEATLVPYLLHPFVLKLLRPLLAAGLRTATDGAPPEVLGTAVILETLIVPFALLGGLAAVGKALAALVQHLQKHGRGKPAADAASRSAYDELQPLSDT